MNERMSDILAEIKPEWNQVRMLEKIGIILLEIRDDLKEIRITCAKNARNK